MPAKKPDTSKKRTKSVSRSASKTKATHPPKTKYNKVVLGIIFSPLILLLGLGVYFVIEDLKYQKAIETRLEERYNQDFVVGWPTQEGVDSGGGWWKASAHPKDRPDLTFTTSVPADLQGGSDGYPEVFWHQEASDYVKPVLTNIFGYTPEYTIQVGTYWSATTPIRGHLPSLVEGLKKYPQQISIGVKVTSREKINGSSKIQVAERTHCIAEELKNDGFVEIDVDYTGSTGGSLKYSLGGPPLTGYPYNEAKTIEQLTSLVEER